MRFSAIRLHYLLVYAVIGAYMPYLPVFLGRDLGMHDAQIGWVTGIYGLSVLLGPPLVTYLADRRFAGRSLIAAAYLAAALALSGLALVDSFVAVLLLSFLFSLVYTPLFALLDGLAFAAIAAARAAGAQAPRYDRLRVWGSLGFMVPAFVLFSALRAGAASGRAAILAAAVAAGLGALCSLGLPRLLPAPSERLPGAAAWQVLRRPPTRALVIPLGLMSAAISVFYAFYARRVLDVGIDPSWVGLVMNLGVLAELPYMFAAGPLLRRFSLRALLLFGALCLALRMALLAAFADPAVTVASQILHGPVVVAIYLLPPMYLNFKASPGVRNGVQGLHTMICYGVARLLGSVAGGYAAELDLAWAFVLGAALSALAFAWLWLRFHDPDADAALRAREPAAA